MLEMRRSIMATFAAATAFCGAAAACADTNVRYVYDALGRLVVLDQRTPGTGGYTARYWLDAASNRAVVTSEKIVRTAVLPSGASLPLGTGIDSSNGQYRLTLQQDGNLVLYDGAVTPIWFTTTFNPTNAHLDMQPDGNLVLYEGGQYVWSSQTFNHPGAYLAVQNDSNIVVYDANGTPLWARWGL